MNEKTPNKTSGIVDYKELTYYRPSEKLTGKGGTANQKVTRGKFRKKINENEIVEKLKDCIHRYRLI
ncbi:hypothetical protein [Candidatus Mesenet endosymbiont of Phosphuga atrata]|uniref:hypothetical protein n=1 Tax=Candidatus Mesenet endosymbiont of Phosphuga atrata TaxID=3066221 RepID=UPI0030CA7664